MMWVKIEEQLLDYRFELWNNEKENQLRVDNFIIAIVSKRPTP